jgi:hypothetical protein
VEDIVAYVVLFAIGLGVLYAYQYRRLRPRQTPFSVQIYPECILKILVQKQHGKIQTLIFRVIARKKFYVKECTIELINKKREFHHLNFNEINGSILLSSPIGENKYADAQIPFQEFKTKLESQDKTFQTFRLVVENDSGKKFKTHELTFNKNWTIYKPDSGKYN